MVWLIIGRLLMLSCRIAHGAGVESERDPLQGRFVDGVSDGVAVLQAKPWRGLWLDGERARVRARFVGDGLVGSQ
jgi:hypothetical protein